MEAHLELTKPGYSKHCMTTFFEKDGNDNRALFDIVAGTSAGAINAVLLVNYVIQRGTWKGSADILLNFWKDVSTSTWYFENPFMEYWQDTAHFFRDQSNSIWKQFFEPVDEIYGKGREKWPLLPFYYYWPDKYGPLATAESSRRYKSWFQFSQTLLGTPNVLSPAILQPDFRFFNPLNTLLRYDNSPMTEIILRHWEE